MENFSPREVYAVELMGDDLTHLIRLIEEHRQSDCLACERVERAAKLAKFTSLIDDPESAA